MSDFRRLFITAGASWILSTAYAAPAGAACRELEGAKPETHLAYLERERSALNTECIEYAMIHLGFEHHLPAIGVLIKWLDYRRPEVPSKDPAVVQVHPTWQGSIYPAMTALFMIGKPAVPDLISVVANRDATDLVRDHALETYRMIGRDDPPNAVAALVRASREAADAGAGQRLWDAAKQAATRCSPQIRNDCIHTLDVH